MRSSTVKLLHPIGGRPAVAYVVDSARAARCRRIVSVLGVQADEVRAAMEGGGYHDARWPLPAVEFCRQREQLGTAHAVLSAENLLRRVRGVLLILNGDVPLVRPATLAALVAQHRRRRAALTVLTTRLVEPAGYGRILRGADGGLLSIHEQADIRGLKNLEAIKEINAGLYCANFEGLFKALRATSRRNAQREYYLPDLVGVLRDGGGRVEAMLHGDAEEVLGINTRADLARAAGALYRRKAQELMESGVTFVDPDATYVDPDVSIGPDTILYPMVHLQGRTKIASGCIVHAGSRITDSTLAEGAEILDHCVVQESIIGRGARVGPFAHLRPGTELGEHVRIGNFVETKKAAFGTGAKANHLAYLGDAVIGRNVNVGAGTITCNYDGWNKNKTILEDDVFIGSDTQLVAPVRVGRGSFVGAGSTITKDVPPGSLALSRAKQTTIKGWAHRKRREMAARKKGPPKKR